MAIIDSKRSQLALYLADIWQKPNVASAEPSVLFGFGRPLLSPRVSWGHDKKSIGHCFTLFLSLQSLIVGVFRQFLAIFDPKRSPSTLSTLGLGGHKRGKNRFGTVFSYFRGLQSLIFGFLAFFGNFWRFSNPKGHHRPF